MKILVLSWMIRKHSNRQHLGTLDKLNDFDNVDCYIYGRKELEPYKDNLKNKIIELVQVHKPDVVIVYAAMFFIKQGFLFREIKGCLKICIETDFHNIYQWDNIPGQEKWYKDNKFDFMMYRNGNDTSTVGIPSVWWPWSASQFEFYPDNKPRKNLIGFAGSSAHRLYTVRKPALKILEISQLIDNQGKNILRDELPEHDVHGNYFGEWKSSGAYPKYVRSVDGFLTTTENRGPFAKTFEAMSSMTPVLSSPIINKDLLFGGQNCYVEYKYDCSDLVEKARRLLNEPSYSKMITKNAYSQFIDKHTTRKRVQELYDHIDNLLKGKEIERKWGF